jgi:hypothetical protein
MKQRTESDILSKSSIKVMLGSVEYDIKPLTILKAREWRTKFVAAVQDIVSNLSVTEQSSTTMAPAMTAALIRFPERLAELVFAYSPELNPETILADATEEQLESAFSAVMILAYPYLTALQTTLMVTKPQLTIS